MLKGRPTQAKKRGFEDVKLVTRVIDFSTPAIMKAVLLGDGVVFQYLDLEAANGLPSSGRRLLNMERGDKDGDKARQRYRFFKKSQP